MPKAFPQAFKDSAKEQWRRHITLYQTILGNGDLRFSTPNYTVSVQCYVKSGFAFAANMGPAARVQPSGDRYMAAFVSGTNDLRLYKNIGGVNTLLANSAGLGRNPNDGYTLTITVSGSTISATFNDGSSLSVSATDSSLAFGDPGLATTGVVGGDFANFQQTDYLLVDKSLVVPALTHRWATGG